MYIVVFWLIIKIYRNYIEKLLRKVKIVIKFILTYKNVSTTR